MKSWILAIAMGAVALAGCGDDGDARMSGPQGSAPETASGGASAGASRTGPAGERIENPSAPPQTAQSGAETKPDPGDANDHSNPKHDARTKASGD